MDPTAIDERVREAREKAEQYTKAANDRQEEYAEKEAMIQQLQRELASTVDALNKEREENERSRSVSPDMNMVNTMYLPPPPPSDSESSRVLELLRSSQEETSMARKELVALKNERDRLMDQVAGLKRQLDRLIEEREELLQSVKNTDGKLQFKSDDIQNMTNDLTGKTLREHELMETLTAAEEKTKQLQSNLAVMTADLRSSQTYCSSLEQRLAEVTTMSVVSDTESLLQTRLDEMEKMGEILTKRAEQAENALKTLMNGLGAVPHEEIESNTDDDGWVKVHKTVEEGLTKSRHSQEKLERWLSNLQGNLSSLYRICLIPYLVSHTPLCYSYLQCDPFY